MRRPFLLLTLLTACTAQIGGEVPPDTGAPPNADPDAGPSDRGGVTDRGVPSPDLGFDDQGLPIDGGELPADGGAPNEDAGFDPDATFGPDATPGPDAAPIDSGAADTGIDPCQGVTCDGHGSCVSVGVNPACSCDPGYRPNGLGCELIPVGGLNIPTTHPRLFFDAAHLTAAQDWYALHPYTPVANVGDPGRALEAAAHGVITGNANSCRSAIDWAMSVQFSCPGVSCDPARWDGEGAIVTFDWCYDQMTPGERSTFITRWNTYVADLNAKPWGGIGMEGNNYYLGYLRNDLLWAIASYHENVQAQAFLDYGLNTRWDTSLKPYYDGAAKGGQPHEGSAYGRRVFAYLTIPFASLAQLGRPIWDETAYFMESIYWLIYSTTPGATNMDNGEVVFETFPFNEDERWLERDPSFNTAQTTLGTYLAPLRGHWAGQPIAGHLQHFLDLTQHEIDDRFAEYAYNPTSFPAAAIDFSNLPLDYYVPGLGTLYAKTSWGAQSTLFTVQAKTPVAVGHEHLDVGGFQLWRNGRFLARETVGYAQDITGYAGNGAVDCGSAVGHNTLLFDGIGPIGYHHHRPEVLRLDSQPDYAYVAMDLEGAYEVADDWAHREDEVGNPRAGTIVRELWFIRPLETLVILDRLSSEGTNPAAAVKTFLFHFPTNPTVIDAQTYEATYGGQDVRLTTVLPTSTTRRVINEAHTIGQYRAEIETSGAVESTFLHVLQLKNGGAAPLTISSAHSGTTTTLTLTDPTQGTAIITMEDGLTSSGGAFGYAASGVPAPQPLRADVRSVVVTTSGPAWGN